MIVTVCLVQGRDAHVAARRSSSSGSTPSRTSARWTCSARTRPGTLTADHVVLERHCDVELEEDDEVLVLAYLNSHFQTGLKNVLDRAVLAHPRSTSRSAIPELPQGRRDPLRLHAGA